MPVCKAVRKGSHECYPLGNWTAHAGRRCRRLQIKASVRKAVVGLFDFRVSSGYCGFLCGGLAWRFRHLGPRYAPRRRLQAPEGVSVLNLRPWHGVEVEGGQVFRRVHVAIFERLLYPRRRLIDLDVVAI